MSKTYKYINLNYLNDFSENDISFRKMMLQNIVNEIPPFISDVERLYQQQEWENLRIRIHKFIAVAPFAGISSVLEIMRTSELTIIEILQGNQDTEKLKLLQNHLNSCVEAFSNALSELEQELNTINE